MKIATILLLSCLACNVGCQLLVDKESLDLDSPRDCFTEDCGYHIRPIPLSQKNPESEFSSDFKNREKRIDPKYPQYKDIANTSFTCKDKPYVPGFYADLETNCLVFHICYNSVVEHFLCPRGTAFDQKNLICNHLDQVECQSSSSFYNENLRIFQENTDAFVEKVRDNIKDKLVGDESNDSIPALEDNENRYLKVLILTQLMEVSDQLSEVLKLEIVAEKARDSRSMANFGSSEIVNRYLPLVIAEIFPLLPERYNASLTGGIDKVQPVTERARQPRSAPSEKIPESIPKLILKIIDETPGIISGVSRNILASNYIAYLKKLPDSSQ